MPALSSTGLCSFCDKFDVRLFADHDCIIPGYRYQDVAGGALDGCSFCRFVLDLLTAPESCSAAEIQAWTKRVQRQRRLQAMNASSIGELPRALWERFFNRDYWRDSYVRFRFTSNKNPKSGAMGISAMYLYPCLSYNYQLNIAADYETPAYISGDIRGGLLDNRNLTVEQIAVNITEWHASCRAGHDRCNQTLSRSEPLDLDNSALPSRCIEVERVETGEDSVNDVHLRLVLRETSGQSGRYLSLSHRWGPETALSQTTVENYSSRLETGLSAPGTGANTITALFADTCTLAMALGIKYVWIDTICIIQNDADDWEREGVKMAGYYQHAWVTIAATVTNPDGGLFFAPKKEDEVPRLSRLPYRNREGDPAGFFYVQVMEPDVVGNSFAKDVAESKLRERGWVLQESLLSTRVVSFSQMGIFVECRSARARPGIELADTRIIHDDYASHVQRATAPPITPSLGVYTSGDVLGENPLFLYENWYDLVSRYSDLKLTYIEKDRLVALAGIASEFGRAIAASKEEGQGEEAPRPHGDEEATVGLDQPSFSLCYASGLWLDNLSDGLLWEQTIPGPRSRAQGLPTWSWASMLTRKTSEGTGGEESLGGLSVYWPKRVISPFTIWLRIAHPLIFVQDAVVIPVTTTDDTNGQQQQHVRYDLPTTRLRSPGITEDGGGGLGREYGNANRFVALSLRGKLLRVDSLTYREGGEGDWPAGPEDSSSKLCRRYRVTLVGTRLSGWASLEHPDYQAGCCDDSTTAKCYALILARESPLLLWYAMIKVYPVLIVREVQTAEAFRPSYERVGVGEIWGIQVEKGFPSVEESTIWLV